MLFSWLLCLHLLIFRFSAVTGNRSVRSFLLIGSTTTKQTEHKRSERHVTPCVFNPFIRQTIFISAVFILFDRALAIIFIIVLGLAEGKKDRSSIVNGLEQIKHKRPLALLLLHFETSLFVLVYHIT